jgi:hypothetical protein
MATEWEAVYSDGTSLKQFTDSKEALFKDIQQDKLKEFRVFHEGRVLSLFPETGTFGINGLLYNTDISNQELNYRLIYFARRRQNMGCGGQAESCSDSYHLGFQTDIDGKCHKRIICMSGFKISFNNG